MFNKTNFNTFRHHLNELNKYLPHFLVQVHLISNCVPVGLCKKLTSQFEVRYRINGIFFCGWAKNWEPAKMPGEISQFLHHPPTFKSFGHVDFVLGEHEEHKLCNKRAPSKQFFYLPNKNFNWLWLLYCKIIIFFFLMICSKSIQSTFLKCYWCQHSNFAVFLWSNAWFFFVFVPSACAICISAFMTG